MSKSFKTNLTTSEKMNFPNFSEIKKTTDIVRVVESYGIALKKGIKEWKGLCPFHKDDEASMHVNQAKGVFHCKGCGATGNAIQFVARKEGVDDKEAALKLLTQIPGVRRAENPPPSVPPGVNPDITSGLLKRVVAFYAKTLMADRAGYDYLKTRNLVDPTMLEVFQVGYCNGTLHQALPKSGEIIEGLKALGVLSRQGGSGVEMLRGRVTVPIFDAQGNVSGLYARNVQPCPPAGARRGEVSSPWADEKKDRHRYLAGPHRGVFNGTCAKMAQTLFITEAIFDAMALWQAGFRNVISLYGTDGWTSDHEALIRDNGTVEIFLALDNNEAGGKATERLRGKLSGMVKTVHVIQWPEGVKDACDFFLSRSATDFESLLKAANPPKADKPDTTPKSEVTARLGEEQIEMTPQGFAVSYGVRRYELMAIEKPSAARLRATVKALGQEPGRFHIDTVDFYLSRSRRNFLVEAARLFRETPEVIEMDLNRLIVQLKSYVEKRMSEDTPRVTLVSEGDKLEALRLGRNPDLVGEIRRDARKLGVVGESDNALLDYAAMTSRKLDDPLAVHILASSGAGKSFLLDMILSLCPPEDLIRVTSLSDKALFYKGENSLVHKVLAVEEVDGAIGARYALRNLISQKILISEATIKNPLTGRMEVQQSIARGPAQVFETSTRPDTDAETRSRYIIQTVDESPEQTRAILEAQRQSHTLEGLLRKQQAAAIRARHHAFQRMLKPFAILNPFEPLLTYGDKGNGTGRLIFRRDHPKYLHLILAITFLHQMQRPIKHHPQLGDYIETTLEDIAVANELATALFGLSLDDLSSPSRQLLRLISEHVAQKAQRLGKETDKIRFNRRELRETFKWTDARLRLHLAELVGLEYILPVGGGMGKAFEYQLLCDPERIEDGKLFVPGLKSVEQLAKEARVAGVFWGVATTPQVESCGVEKDVFPSLSPSESGDENGNGKGNLAGFGGGHIPVLCGKNGQNGSIVIGLPDVVPLSGTKEGAAR